MITSKSTHRWSARRQRTWAAGVAVCVAGALAPAPGATAKVEPVGGGKTHLGIRGQIRDYLADSDTSLKATKPAKLKKKKKKLSFPIKRGELSNKKAKGKLKQDGGIQLDGPGGKLELTKFVVKLGKSSKLKAKDGKKNVPLLELDTEDAKVKQKGGKTKVSGVKGILTSKGTAMIEAVTEEELEGEEVTFGGLKIAATAGDVKLKGGNANVKFDPSASGAFTAAGITQSPIDPATAGAGKIKLPIAGGKVADAGSSGIARLDGGLAFIQGATRLELTKLRIDLDDGEITAQVAGNRITVLSFDPSEATTKTKKDKVTITDIVTALTADGATAFNEAFGTAFTEGAAFGTFKVKGTT